MGGAARPHIIRFLAVPQMVQRRLSHDCCRGRGRRPLLKLSRRPIKSVCKCVYGAVARVVYSRLLADWTKPQPGRLKKSPGATSHTSACKLTGSADTPFLILQRQTVTSHAAVRIY